MIKCVICENDIYPNAYGWDGGNNAWPVKEGQCCDTCDEQVVLPKRLVEVGYHAHEAQRMAEEITEMSRRKLP